MATVTRVRPIVRDPALLGGRWHLAGSEVAVAEVRLDHAARGTTHGYAYPGVSSEELAACLSWVFPAIRASAVTLLTGSVIIACECGEDTPVVGTFDEPIRCVCGRCWRVTLGLEALGEPALH